MKLWNVRNFCLAVLAIDFTASARGRRRSFNMRMPGVRPATDDAYLCRAFKAPPRKPIFITRFTPRASQLTVHHMIIHGCTEPGYNMDNVWNCGEMQAGRVGSALAGPCGSGGKSQIIYAWAKDAPELELPEGVGFKVGGDSDNRYLVLQVHYLHKMDIGDSSGFTLHLTSSPVPREAGILLLGTAGVIPPLSHTRMDVACQINEPVRMHPFAFRTHTHKLGVRVSGYRWTDGPGGEEWVEIGSHNPQEPQMFYPTKTNQDFVVKQGDAMAAECCMINNLTHSVEVGYTKDDEMCNFYMMYWLEETNWGTLKDNMCFSPGPPYYSWEAVGFANIPDEKC